MLRRMRAVSIAAGLVISATIFSLAAFAVDGGFAVFGPQDYQRGTGRPAPVKSTFNVAQAGNSYRLRVFNGGEGERFPRVNSAVVVLNGKQIIGPADFGAGPKTLERTIALYTSNTLEVELRSAPGSGLTIAIDGQQSSPPIIQGIASPAPNPRGWNNSSVRVSFSCSDAISGIASCSDPSVLSGDGAAQTIIGTAVNNAGLSAHSSVIVNLDKTAPAIMASVAPAPNANGWNNTDAVVSFNCSDALSGIASCATPVNVTTAGAAQAFGGSAADNAGNTASATAYVSVDKTAPALSVASLPGMVLNGSLEVHGTVSDALSGVSGVNCNGNPASLTGSAFTCAVSLGEGLNTIHVAAADAAGNTASATADVTLTSFVPPPLGAVAVSWMGTSGVSTSGNSLVKTNASSAWNAGAGSLQVLRDGYGFVEFTATETSTARMAGLGVTDSNLDYTDVDYGILIRNDASLAIYESGTYRGDFGFYAAADRFRVEVRYGVVRYLRNGAPFFTSPSPARYPLRVDTSLFTPGATLTDVRMGNFVWTDPTGVQISGESIVKTGAAGWNSGAVSTNTLESGDGYLEFTAATANAARIAGLGNLSTGVAVSDIRFGVQLNSDGTFEIVEGGVSLGNFGGYSSGDRFRVELAAGAIRYYQNGLPRYTSLQPPTYPLRARAVLNTPGATVTNVMLEPIALTAAQNVFTGGALLIKTNAEGWTSGASSTNNLLSGDGYVEFTATETNRRRGAGLQSGSVPTLNQIDFALALQETGVIEVVELGISRGLFGPYQTGDRFRIEIQNGIVRYLKNGGLLHTSVVAPSYPLHAEAVFYTEGATLFDLAMGDEVWTNAVNTRAAGRSLLKTSGSVLWNAGAVSTKTISSQGYVEFTASESSTYRIAGLSNGDSNQNYTDIDFGILLRSDNTVAVYEAGTHKGDFGVYIAGDRFRVEVNLGVVRYSRNGVVFYTSSAAPLMPLRVDTALNGANATLFNIVIH